MIKPYVKVNFSTPIYIELENLIKKLIDNGYVNIKSITVCNIDDIYMNEDMFEIIYVETDKKLLERTLYELSHYDVYSETYDYYEQQLNLLNEIVMDLFDCGCEN